jgi:16S rRNA processing protein RimM
MASKNLVSCGKVLKPHGLKGELCIALYADSPFFLDSLGRLYLQKEGQKPRPFRLLSWRPHQNKVLVFFENIIGRDQAEEWRGAEVLVREKDLPPKDEGEVYLYELLDCRVYLPDGGFLGVLKDVQVHSGSEVWVIITDNEEEVLFPANEEFVEDVDLTQKRIVINPPEGLLDIYLNQVISTI